MILTRVVPGEEQETGIQEGGGGYGRLYSSVGLSMVDEETRKLLQVAERDTYVTSSYTYIT